MTSGKTNTSLNDAKAAKYDEFYTQLSDIENELRHYKGHFRGKVVFCNCDDPYESDFFKYFALNFNHLGLKKLIATCYSGSPITGTKLSMFGDEPEEKRTPYKAVVTTVHDTKGDGGIDMFDVAELFRNGENQIERLKGDGDFRSPECVELLKEADIVVTNPPFSLFREYVAQLIEHKKQFLIIGNLNIATSKDVFPLIRNNQMWLGVTRTGTGSMWFRVSESAPDKTGQKVEDGVRYQTIGSSAWFTNLDHRRRHETIPLYKKYSPEEYPTYANYDAIEVPKVELIPLNFSGSMGVPITFLGKYSPSQFEILGTSGELANPIYIEGKKKSARFYVGTRRCYDRVVIRHKHPEIKQ